MKIAGDIIIANSEMPGNREIAARYKKTIPPNILADEAQGDPKVALSQATNTIQQLEAQNHQLMQQNSQMMQTIKEERISADKDIQVAQIRASAQIEAAALSAKLDLARMEFEKFMAIHQSAHEQATAAVASKREQDLATQNAVTPSSNGGGGISQGGA